MTAPTTMPIDAAEAAEDHDRVDRDQQADVVVSRQRRCWRSRADRSSESGRAPHRNTNASSFSRLTGMLITSAARGSSRSARHARPVRESLTNMSRTKKTRHADQQEVVLPLGRVDRVAEEVERVDVRDSIRSTRRDRCARQSGKLIRLALLTKMTKRLAEEERHDREVVAEQTRATAARRAGRRSPYRARPTGIAASACQW